MMLKLCFVFIFFIEICCVERKTEKLTYQSLVTRIEEQCGCDDWQEGVLKYYEGTSNTSKTYPGSTDQPESVMSAFEVFLSKLLDLTEVNSKILSLSTTAILDAMSKLSKLGGTYGNLFKEAIKSLPQLSDDLRKVISNLSQNVGELITNLMNDAITDLERSILHFAFLFEKCGVEHFGNDLAQSLNYEPITKHTQVLMNLIALIAETSIYECNLATPKILESLAVITLISNWYFIGAHSINVVSNALLHEGAQSIPDKLYVSLTTMRPLLQDMADVIDAIDKSTNLELVFKRFVNFTVAFNAKLSNSFGCFDGVPTTNVGQITVTLLEATSGAR